MNQSRWLVITLMLAGTLLVIGTSGQERPRPEDPRKLAAAQADAMKSLAFMDGIWRGPAWTLAPSGAKESMIQTERVGSFMNGTLKVIEGRGYEADGTVGFNSLAIVSYNAAKKSYSLRSYAQGRVGDFAIKPTVDGFVWEIPAGPTTIRFTAVIQNGTWHEVGDQIASGKEPLRFIEMNLKRIGDTDWPSAGTVPQK